MPYRETYFKKYLKDAGIIGPYSNVVDSSLMDVLQKVYYMGVSRAVEKPFDALILYENIPEQHNLDY